MNRFEYYDQTFHIPIEILALFYDEYDLHELGTVPPLTSSVCSA